MLVTAMFIKTVNKHRSHFDAVNQYYHSNNFLRL